MDKIKHMNLVELDTRHKKDYEDYEYDKKSFIFFV